MMLTAELVNTLGISFYLVIRKGQVSLVQTIIRIAILIFALALTGCPAVNDECRVLFTLQGRVVDVNGNPIGGVSVLFVTHYGFESDFTVTDSDGNYSKVLGFYSDLGNSYLIFRKTGLREVDSSSLPYGKGDGRCVDQKLIRNAIIEP
ncbi:carboxypeptidase-like regulatory domain-containing protein [Bdellovibrio sp.]|uniref:carboxypeptidase-like regulatory domain-containing protein n=1 Tax=Bdellovibrio sp. TaxID=28201 RepID=UPI0039E38F20